MKRIIVIIEFGENSKHLQRVLVSQMKPSVALMIGTNRNSSIILSCHQKLSLCATELLKNSFQKSRPLNITRTLFQIRAKN